MGTDTRKHIDYDAPIRDDDADVTYFPFRDDRLGVVGFQCMDASGAVSYIYLCPSGGSDDGVPTVFVYEGVDGDPALDQASHHYTVEVQ